MMEFLPTIIIRHRKENLKKCSLTGLEKRGDLYFITYPLKTALNLSQYILLSVEGPVLTKEDTSFGLLLLDATWRYAAQMEKDPLFSALPRRSLPKGLKTAYPRRQTDCPLPEQGLASIEALYAAHVLLGKDSSNLLDHYYWKESFLVKNSALLL